MYAKVFTQIFDSSIADDYELRHFFMDMLVLAGIDGVVDMTHEAIAARTRMPLNVIKCKISELEQPDPRSRSHNNDGRRLIRIDEQREWGWQIVNYHEYRRIASEEQRREMTKKRTRKWRDSKCLSNGDAGVTHGDAGDAMQRQRQRQTTKLPTKPKKSLSGEQKRIADNLEKALGDQWVNDAGKWIGRIRSNFEKVDRVCAEVVDAIKENRVVQTPAQYAEYTWGEFK